VQFVGYRDLPIGEFMSDLLRIWLELDSNKKIKSKCFIWCRLGTGNPFFLPRLSVNTTSLIAGKSRKAALH
jgi:hypothetical protein